MFCVGHASDSIRATALTAVFAVALVRRFVGHADHALEPTVDPGLPAKLWKVGPEQRPNDHSPKTVNLQQRQKGGRQRAAPALVFAPWSKAAAPPLAQPEKLHRTARPRSPTQGRPNEPAIRPHACNPRNRSVRARRLRNARRWHRCRAHCPHPAPADCRQHCQWLGAIRAARTEGPGHRRGQRPEARCGTRFPCAREARLQRAGRHERRWAH